jgi:hypothetical protein
MPIGTIETINVMLRKLVYGRADGMPNSLESMVVCSSSSSTVAYNGSSGVPQTVIFSSWKLVDLAAQHMSA